MGGFTPVRGAIDFTIRGSEAGVPLAGSPTTSPQSISVAALYPVVQRLVVVGEFLPGDAEDAGHHHELRRAAPGVERVRHRWCRRAPRRWTREAVDVALDQAEVDPEAPLLVEAAQVQRVLRVRSRAGHGTGRVRPAAGRRGLAAGGAAGVVLVRGAGAPRRGEVEEGAGFTAGSAPGGRRSTAHRRARSSRPRR